ncbi:exodeoxyribonuclease V subunit beta [Bacteriovorax sp. Seq25_V]|uniref:UvrD-helicase domain-containing protein n=1 Tax=Bacteriovorax sp. Seq25_V TaxID=1201288 RepID=UPI00038A056A|nr:UvrD-helicase domain-containing protein [Bacteriovorax sp. Seq25_V]EQC44664.1 UvrD/REP helicase N-terminal domain protein [Bacteriovorax sp. Seq25_V]
MSNANSEQLKAIQHHGGVLLNAGAGSGKTFVLIEHIKFLIDDFFKTKSSLISNERALQLELQTYLSKIVLMTFTNEAAKELKVRLYRKFEGLEDYPHSLVYDCLKFINVSTIHGFCLKLIKSGLIKNVPSEINLVDQAQIDLKVAKLVEKWFENNQDLQNREIFVKNFQSITDAMIKIFSSPELRAEWASSLEKEHDILDEQQYFKEVLQIEGVLESWESQFDLSEYDDKYSDKNWYKLVQRANTVKGDLSWSSLKTIILAYQEAGRVMPPKIAEVKEELDSLKAIREFAKKNEEDFDYYFNNQADYQTWFSTLKSLFSFVDEAYYKYEGLSFSDLEYLVYQTVSFDKSVCEEIAKKYEYFIVDEYQDTSHIQYEIITSCLQGKFEKLFCVGDKKQAIYGFRGGELGVFIETSKKIPLSLSMTNNYRSEETVVKFNNDLFATLFPMGKDFEGADNFTVKVDAQTYPDTKEGGQGSIERIVVDVTDEEIKRISSGEIGVVEGRYIRKEIQKKLEEGSGDVCVLYRNLGPSKFLIQELLENNIPFEAQVKIPFKEDPIFIIFRALIDALISYKLDEKIESSLKYLNFYIEGVLSHYNIQVETISEETFLKFANEVETVGIKLIFYKLIFKLGIANSLFKQNSAKVDEAIDINNGNIDSIWDYIKKFDSENYSTKFYSGTNSRVKIMTTHASKGLQFDYVFLGGIHNNGKTMPNLETLGKLPGSFRWSSNLHRKKLYKSPLFIYENLVSNLKEFAESKRLFYVACTRAVKSITWCDLSFNNKLVSLSKSSWICGLRKFDSADIEIETNQDVLGEGSIDATPLYFKDDLGVSLGSENLIGLISELSVTKLATLAQCSRKFFLKQLLKFDEQWKEFASENEIEIPSKIGISDKDRGIEIHYQIENIIKGKEYSSKYKDVIDWIHPILTELKNSGCELRSEEEMKFSLFGQMMTGISDLYIEKDGELTEIWDFKTGVIDSTDLETYFFQLMCYAHGLQQIHDLNDQKNITLKILALDLKKIEERTLSLGEIRSELFKTWQKLSDFSANKINHCTVCEYGNLCHQVTQ